MKQSKVNPTFAGREKGRDIRRHPIKAFRQYVKAGLISRLPKLAPEFRVVVAPNQDFIVRLYVRGARPIEVKCQCDVNGGMTVLADRSVEIELIGTAAADRARFATAEKRAKSKSK
jgi:hypothetical protein